VLGIAALVNHREIRSPYEATFLAMCYVFILILNSNRPINYVFILNWVNSSRYVMCKPRLDSSFIEERVYNKSLNVKLRVVQR